MKNAIMIWLKQLHGSFPKKYSDCTIASSSTYASPDKLILGRWVYIGSKSFVDAKGGVSIGDGAILSSRVTILSSGHNHLFDETIPYGGADIYKPVNIARGVWIGYGAIIMPGVVIGDGAIVGAGSVVTRDIAPGQIVAGNPARPIGTRNGEKWRALIAQQQYHLRHKLGGC